MIFIRSVPSRKFGNYRNYRSQLRSDFQNRCAYCLTHEYFLGSDANFVIDHRKPINGKFSRPELENDYANLYWTCNECNQNKADNWPSEEERLEGFDWIDPCDEEGDHDLHWLISSNGSIQWITTIGEYTVKKLMLHRRDWLRRHWARLSVWQDMQISLVDILATKDLQDELREVIELQLIALKDLISPPVFDRPRKRSKTVDG